MFILQALPAPGHYAYRCLLLWVTLRRFLVSYPIHLVVSQVFLMHGRRGEGGSRYRDPEKEGPLLTLPRTLTKGPGACCHGPAAVSCVLGKQW